MEVKYTLTQALRDVFMAALGIMGGVLTRQFRTSKERIVDTSEALDKQGRSLNDAFNRIEKLENDNKRARRDYQILWSYLLEVIESHIKHTKTPPPMPPKELESDPELTEIFARIKRRKRARRV